MRTSRLLFLIFVLSACFLLGNSFAFDLGNHPVNIKDNSHGAGNQGQPDGREGGETFSDAIEILSMPFTDTGNTSDNINDYDASCPYTGSSAPDVVYKYTPNADVIAQIDLCGSGYDTKAYIMDASLAVIACNDDFYTGDPCGLYVSFIDEVPLSAGMTYYIIIDGYGSNAGDYVLNVVEYAPPPPCIIECEGHDEGEPTLGDGYIDMWNSGCNDEFGYYPFHNLLGDPYGELVFCGVSGWYSPDGVTNLRDTDWFLAVVGEYGMIEWTLDAEQASLGFLLGPQDCATVGVELSMEVGPCVPATMAIQGNPGDIVWLWAGPSVYVPPAGFVGHEYNYMSSFVGLEAFICATDNISFGGLKSLFR